MAAGRIVVSEYTPARDRNDALVAGAKLYVYTNGTTTLASIYTSATLVTALANPVVANSSGQFAQVWADAALTYTVSVTGASGESIGNPSVFDDYSPSTNFAVSEVEEFKAPVRVASTANITIASALINASTIDGVVVATGDRVLLKDQSTASQNGIYVVVASGAASRSGDADTSAKVTSGMTMFVSEGTASAGAEFSLTTANTITLGTTALTFSRYSGILPIANGGTGAATAAAARTALGSTTVGDAVFIAATAAAGRSALGSTVVGDAVYIAASAAAARTAIGAVIGTDVQAYDADLATWATITPGTGVGTALAVAVGSAGAFTTFNGAGGTPSSMTLTNATGLPISTGVSGLGTGVATFLATPSSANLAAAVTDETGTGALVLATSPTLVTPALGTPSAAVLTNATGLPVAGITASTTQALGVGSVELGHATDTTLARSSAGNMTIEGNLVYRAGGTDVPVADGGTGASTAADARTALAVVGTVDLAASTGAALVGSIQAGTGATARTVQTKLRDVITAQDYGATGDGVTTGQAAFIQAAIDYANGLGGGTVVIPRGTYLMGTTVLVIKPNVKLRGEGYNATILEWSASHTGDGIRFNGNINHSPSSLQAFTEVSDLQIKCTNALNVAGGAYVDIAGTFLSLYRIKTSGFGYAVIFDQSELAAIDQCILQSSNTALIWLTNGPEHTVGAASFYTNRISVTRNQLDQGVTIKPCVQDDGGYNHLFSDNNYNGGTYHHRAAGTSGLVINASEWEGNSANPCVIFTNLTVAGNSVGSCTGVTMIGNLIVPVAGQSCINIVGVNALNVTGNFLQTSGSVVKISGGANAAGLIVGGNTLNGSGAEIDNSQFDGTLTCASGANNDVALPTHREIKGSPQFMSVTAPGAAFSVTGFVARYNGDHIVIYNGSSFTMTLKQNDAGSVAANRIFNKAGIDSTVGSGASTVLIYRGTSSKWIQIY